MNLKIKKIQKKMCNKKVKNVISFIFFLLFFVPTVKSEITVSVKDTTIKTDRISFPISGTTANFKGKKVEYGFQFNWVHKEILGINFNQNFALTNGNFSYKYDSENRFLTVTSENFSSNFTGTLFEINLRLLPRVDFFRPNEVVTITPKYVRITASENDTTVHFSNISASIFIDTVEGNQTFREAVSANYPNPFGYETVVFFSIDTPTPLKIQLYGFEGSIIQTIPVDIDGALFFTFFDSDNRVIEVNENYEFPRGIYKVVLRVNYAILATGQYRVSFETNQKKTLLNISLEG